jgi:tRNA pseudouridine55 synthase
MPSENGEIIPVFKPRGITSFEVVRRVRSKMKIKRVGHAGTLDPLAEGLLIILTGSKTKLMTDFLKFDKEYLATFRLGVTSKSYDLETELIEQKSEMNFSDEQILDVLKKYVGEIEQVPPEYSAAWVDGKRAYKLARQGAKFELKPKTVSISELKVEKFEPPFLKLKVVCSSGTYVRSLARDIGRDLGCGAVLTELVRTRIGSYTSEGAMKLDLLSSPQNPVPKTESALIEPKRHAA